MPEQAIAPLVDGTVARLVVVVVAYIVTLTFSGRIVRAVALPKRPDADVAATEPPAPDQDQLRQSTIIGKCENVITVTFVLTGQETGLALIFTAKSLVRSPQMRKNPGFYLGGTLVNLVWALTVSFIARVLIAGL